MLPAGSFDGDGMVVGVVGVGDTNRRFAMTRVAGAEVTDAPETVPETVAVFVIFASAISAVVVI